jgi:lysophospholipase L1-like esterase
MLGTNDVALGTTQSAFQANIQTVITACFAGVSTLQRIHLLSSPFLSLTSGALSINGSNFIAAYAAALSALANGTTIFFSQPFASYNFFQAFPNLLSDGIHPAAEGVAMLGGLWGDNVATDMGGGGGTVTGLRRQQISGGGISQ